MEKALSCAGLRVLPLTFLPAWLRNFVAVWGLARSTAAYDGGFGVSHCALSVLESRVWPSSVTWRHRFTFDNPYAISYWWSFGTKPLL